MLFDEAELFDAIARGGSRVLLIGRRAMIALGLPVLTADYDLWTHRDDIAELNEAVRALGFEPTHLPDAARRRGRYVLEDGQHIDVLVAKSKPTRDSSTRLSFDEAWARRLTMQYAEGVTLCVPCIDDLIITKRWGMRDKDVADIRLLESLEGVGEA